MRVTAGDELSGGVAGGVDRKWKGGGGAEAAGIASLASAPGSLELEGNRGNFGLWQQAAEVLGGLMGRRAGAGADANNGPGRRRDRNKGADIPIGRVASVLRGCGGR